MSLPNVMSMKLHENKHDLWSVSSLTGTVRSDGKEDKRIMDEAAFRTKESSRTFCNDGSDLYQCCPIW